MKTPGAARAAAFVAALSCTLVACGDTSRLPIADTTGATPTIVEPVKRLIPTAKIAKAVGWPPDSKPTAAPGTSVNAFALGLNHPRFLHVLPNGDVLVVETNAPPRADEPSGVRAWLTKTLTRKAGASSPSANRITLLRDADGDGIAEKKTVFLSGLNSPFGIALIGDNLYVANTDGVMKYPYADGDTTITAAGTLVVALPAGTINHHWTKTIVPSADATKLYVSIGSNSNVGENGIDVEENRAQIWEVNLADGTHRVFATGLRNAAGLAIEPETGTLWAAVNERDELGSDLVPDYMTSVRDSAFYGWPYSYFGQHVDDRVKPTRPDLIAKAVVPDYALGAHTASIGLAPSKGTNLGATFANGMFVGQHGSWNRNPFSGYKVIFVPFANGKPSGPPSDVLTGFLTEKGEAYGRPVGVAIDKQGSLLVADDVGNVVWRVKGSSATVTAARP